MLNKKRKVIVCEYDKDKRCKLDKKRKNTLELVNLIFKKYKKYNNNYILCDINLILLYGLL